MALKMPIKIRTEAVTSLARPDSQLRSVQVNAGISMRVSKAGTHLHITFHMSAENRKSRLVR